jgi:hypothetical protein
MVVPYLALAALAAGRPGFHQTGIFLAVFYALYYGYPSRGRIDFDRRLFRVQGS